jgi:benzoyl-CoA reductase/2-hydroxyglutaryl-CoA dehydratase subunit BcrC/BadD/HgdB
MRYEVVEDTGEWIVCSDGCELARFTDQDTALSDVAERLRDADSTGSVSLSVRYESRNR